MLLAVIPVAAASEPDDDDFASIELTSDNWTWELAIYDGNGSERRAPIDLPVIGRPALSPDGSRVVFSSWVTNETDGRWGLFIADVDGTNVRTFTAPDGIDRDPAWSPDGEFIAFSRDTVGSTIPSNCCHIRVKAVGGGFHEAVPGTTGGINPSWSPNSNRLTYERHDGVHVTRIDGTGSYRLTGPGGAEPAWSPDGSEIGYIRPGPGGWQAVVRPAGGGADSVRVTSSRRIEGLQWDPDGDTIYYVRYRGQGYDGRSTTQVWMQTEGRNPQQLYTTGRPIVHLAHRAVAATVACDFDASGITDLAIGIPGENAGGAADTGAVGILYATGSGLDAAGSQWWSQAQGGIKGAAGTGHAFGHDVACGDFDADGAADLAVGIPGDGPDAGAVSIIRGAPGGLTSSSDDRWTQDSPGIGGRVEPDHAFGSALATGDIDGNGYDDLAIGIPGDKTTAGAVTVMYGRAGGLGAAGDERWHQDVPGVPGASKADHNFGGAVAFADFDGDGDDDLAVGVPGDINSAGSVVVIQSTGDELSSDGARRWHQDVPGIGGRRGWQHHFGETLATGDFDGDGYDDLAIGIPGDKTTAGAVSVLYGTNDGLSHVGDDRWHQDVPGIAGETKADHRFGAALTTGDFDRDGYDDLAIGIPGDKKTAGAVTVLYGGSGGLSAAGDQRWHHDKTGVAGKSVAGNVFGAALFAGDFDGDGYDDLAIGSPGDRFTKGTVTVLYGAGSGLSATGDQRWHQDVNGVPDTSENGDAYGAGL
jgi:hypothetical protein